MADIKTVYSEALSCGLLDRNVSEERFTQMMGNAQERKAYFDYVRQNHNAFYGDNYERFSAAADKMLGLSTPKQTERSQAGSVGTNPRVEDYPAPTNETEYEANMLNQNWGENDFLAARKGVSARPLEKYSDEALRLRREQILGNAERKKQQSISEQENWEKTHPFLAALSGVSHAGAMPIQSQKEKMQETPDAMYTGEHNAQLQAIEDELGRRAKDTVIPQAIESTRQSEEWTAKVRENSRDMSLHQRNNIGAAEYLNTKANEILNAGSKFDDSNAIANWAEGLKNDLFDRDISGIMSAQRAGRINNIVTKLNSGEELTEDEAVLLNAYINLAAATEARQFDLSTAYQIGQGTAQSVPFMVDMMISHGLSTVGKYGIIKVLAKTGSKHIGAATKWLQVPDKIVASAVKSAGKELGEDIFGAAGKKTAKDFARKAAYEGIATPLQTIAMPSSWEMMLDEAAQTKLQTSKSELSFLDKARIFTNAAQETLTERAGGELIDWGLGRAFGAATKPWHFGGKGQNAITKYIQSPIGETAEEYIGALLNLVRSYNPLYDEESNQQLREGAKEMFTAEGLGKTFGTVLPMSLVGGAVNMGELRVRTREMDKARDEIIRQLTSFCGASEEEAQQIMAYTEGASTAKEFAERLDIVGTHLYNAYENMGYDMEKRDEEGEREGMGATLRQSLNDYAEQAAKMNSIVEQFSDRYADLSDEQKAQAKQALEQVQEQNMQHAAREMAEEDVRDITNKSNNYLYCVGFADGMFPDADEAYIVSGNVAVKHNEYGMPVFDKDASEDQVVAVRIIYEDKTSEVKQLSINDLDLFGEPQSAPEWVDELTNRIYQEMLTTREAQKQAAQQNAQETQPGTQPGQAKPTAQGNAVQQQTTHESVTPIATYRKDGKEIAVVSEKNGIATLSEPISVGENESIHVPTSMLDGLMQQLGYEKNAAAQDEPQPIGRDDQWGNVYQWVTGKAREAVDFLRKHKSGYLRGVFHRDEIGDIDLAWGNDKAGLKHIIQRHIVEQDDFNSVEEAVDAIENTVKGGQVISNNKQECTIDDGKYRVGIAKDSNGNWVVTAYDNSRGKAEKQRNGNTNSPLVVPSTERVSSSDMAFSYQESGKTISDGKGTENNPNTQENPQKNVPFAENLAAAPRDEQGRVNYAAIQSPDEIARVATAQMRGNKDVAKKWMEAKKKLAQDNLKKLKHKADDIDDPEAFLKIEEKAAELQQEVSRWDNAITALRTIRTAEEQAAYDAEQTRQQAEREARKQVQAGTSDGSMASRYASAPKIDGNAGTITAANGQVLKGHYVLVSADGLTPSHDARNGFEMTAGYPTVDGHSINDRDYKNDPEEQAKVRQVAQQYNGNAIKNMPIVSDEGLVYNGNGRIMAGQLAAQQGTDGAYRQALEDNAAQFGFTPEQVVSVPNARVVFQTEERLPYNTTTLAMFNATEQQAQSNTSKAAANTRKLTPEAVGHIINAIRGFENTDAFFTDKKAPFNLIDLLIKDGILSDRDKASLIDGNRLSGAGKDVLTSLLFGTAFDEQTIRLLADSPQVQNSVMRALPQIIENKGLGELSLFDHINNAIAAIYDMREKGMSFYEYTHQTDIYGATAKDNFSAFELLLADEMMSSGVSAFRDVLTMYNERARQENGGQSSMFGETVTRENIENEIVEYYKKLKDEQRKQKQSERGQGSASTQSAVASTQGSDVGRRGNAENARDNGRRQQGDLAEIQPIGVSDFGDVFDAFIGKPAEAIAFLKKRKSGEAIGALYHPEIGDIDLVWGYEGTGRSDGFGLAKLVKYHPEVVSNLQGILSEMVISSRSDTRIQLESSKYKAAIRLTWDGEKKTWLLTAFEKESSVFDKTTDTTETINGKQDDTALPQNTASSAHKGTKKSATDQTKSQKNAENLQNAKHNAQSEDKKEENNPTQTPIPGAKKVNVEGLFSDLYVNGETKLSDHAEDVLSEQATTEHNTLKSQFADNKVFTENMVEAARRRIHEKLNRLNAGLDPEMFTDGAIIAGAYVESGVRKFTDFAKRMIGEFGDKIRPYLKAFYNGLRDMPEAQEFVHELDDYNTVSIIDVNVITADEESRDADTNFVPSDKTEEAPSVDQPIVGIENMTRGEVAAEIVKRNKKAKASKAKTKREDRTLDMFGNEPQSDTELTEDNLHGGQKVLLKDGSVATVMMVSRAGEITPYGAAKPHISSIYLTDGREIQFSDVSAINPAETTATNSQQTKGSTKSVGIPKYNGENSSAQQSEEKAQKRNTHNNHVGRGVDYAPKSTAERIKANIAAIKLLKQLQDDGRQATEQEKEVLRKFTGWGGLGEAFKGEPGTTYYSYSGEKSPYQQLQDMLTPEELEAAQMSRNSAYYTPANVIDTLWDVAVKCGFRGGNVLEGSAGIGEILARIPSNANAQSNITAVEIDPITGGILQQLYPDADVHIDGFQNVNIPNNSQDLVITNVPFVRDLHVTDRVEKDLTKKFGNSIQDFCIAKNILKLREGGVGIFIAGKSSMDSSKKLRAWIVGEAGCDVVGAFRLNKDTFGGTGATADIIVVRKRINGTQPSALSETFVSAPAVSETEVEVDKKWNSKTYDYDVIKKKAILSYNALYQQHPEWMGGEMRIGADEGDTRFGGTSSACYPKSHIDQQRRLADWAKSLQVGIEDVPQTPLEQVIEQAYTNDWEKLPKEKYENLRLYTLMPNSKGEICRLRGGGYLEPISNNNKVKGDTKEQVLKGYNRIKQAISDVLAVQTNSTDGKQLKKAQEELNAAYDAFVSKYGQLNKNTAISFLRNDVDFSSVAAIEQYEEIVTPDGKQIKTAKTDIFSKRVIGVKPEIKPTNITDAIVLSMQQFGGIHVEDIAKWLEKDADSVVRKIVDSRLGFEDPQTGKLQVRHVYLSGNVREKLKYAQENNEDGRYNSNIEELQKVIPQDIPAHLIGFSIGSTWFGEDLFNEFLREKYALDHKVRHIGGVWVSDINENWGKSNEKNRAAGVYSQMLGIQIYGSDLFLAAMNNTPIAVQKKQVNSDKKTETITDKVASQACATRIDEIKDEFTEWARDKMQQNPELAERMERLYNERFNAVVPMEIDSRFTSPYLIGMNPNVPPLYDIQQKAVVRATMQPTLFAHEVGTGKTRSLICSAMEMRRLGTAKKPMIVVQNATVMQFVEEAKNLYPNAKVLTVNYKDRTPEGRKFFYSKIKYNDWDIIIVPQSVFNMMPDSDERKRDFIQAKIEEKEHAYHAAQEAGVDKNTLGKFLKELGRLQDDYAELNLSGKTKDKKEKKGDEKKAAVRRENAKQAAEKMVDRRTDNVENFDDMGIDALLVDEAHNYKHLGFSTMMQRGVKGIDPRYSERGVSLYLKCQAVFEKTGHKNVVFATGTPISNTAAEVWTFMKYLIPEDVMRENEIYYFDDFVRNFGKINQSLEFATNGKFKENTRFASYMNIPELARLWGIITDTRLSDEVKTASGNSLKEEKIPLMENGKPTDIFLEQSRSLVSIMNAVRAQLEKFENMSGAEKRANTSLPLTMYGIAKRAAIDPRLVDDSAVDEAESKTNKTVEETLKALDDSKDYKGTVAIFCDNYRRQDIDEQTNKKKVGFNIYDEIQHKLVKAGVPSEQIAIMQPKMTDTAKQKVFDAVNDGEIRVVLGSTETLGTGVNIQTRLFTLIHMDAPDRPMDMTQREGRILRQGNMHKTMNIPVRIIRLGVKDSLDVTAYQRLKTKSQFIDSVMRSKYTLLNNQEGRTIEEDEEGLYDNPVAVLSGSQYAMLKSQAEREYRKWYAKKKQYEQDQIYINSQTKRNKLDIQAAAKRILTDEKRLQLLNDTFAGNAPTNIVIDGMPANSEEELKTALKTASKKVLDAQKAFSDEYTSLNEETRAIDVPISLDGLLFTAHIAMRKTSDFKNGKRVTMVKRTLSYSSIPLSIENEPVANNTVDLAKVFDEILTKEITGEYAKERIQNAQNLIDRKQKDNEEMAKRFGKPFEYDEQLAAAKAKVEEYTEKMREEMAEKEERYKQTASNFNLEKAIDREVNSDDDDESEAQYAEMDYDEGNLLAEQQVALDAVMTALDKAGIEVEQVSEEEARTEFEKGTTTYKSSGTIYGYAKGGKICLTPKGMNPNTPIHEYAHLWAKAMQHNNPQGWKSVVWRMKGTPMWEEVANDPRYQSLSNEDAIASEVLARYSGKRGAERMAKMEKQMLDRAETRSEVAKTVSLIQRVKKALQDFWKWVGENLFDIKQFSSAEEVADRVLYDLMNGTDIKQQSDSSVRLMLQIMEQGTKGQSNYPIAGAKLQKNLETTKEKYKNIGISTENAITDIAKTLGARNTGTSNYVTIEAKNGKIFTLRISNHNATVSNFDNNGEDNGISIVISRHDNNGITNNGNAHVVEFFYSDKALNKAEGTPIADIIGALEQTMYSGEYKDPTGLAQVQEVNIPADTQTEYSRIQPNETLGEYAHRIAEARRKEQDGERAEFSMSDAPTPDPDETRIDYVARFNMWYNEQRKEEAERDYVQAMQEARRKTERALQVVADRYRPLQKFQEYILSQGGTIRRSEQDADGNLIRTSADAYQDTTLATGRAGYQIQRFASHQLKDMVNAVAAIINSHRLDDIDIRWNNVDTYFTDKKNAKNGTRLTARELVGIYAQAKDCQEAIEQELPDRGKDGFLRNLQDVNGNPVSHTEVIRLVEGALEQEQIDNLWQSINAATQFSLDYQLRNGMIDQATYDQFHRNYYVPERGWRERDLDGREDGYTEGRGTQLNGNPYNAALKKARGRDSIASDPFSYIQSIAETTILSTERNNVKQKFLQMLLDNEEIGMKSGAWKIRRAYVVRVTDSNGEAHEVVTYERPKDESTIVTSVVPETMIAQRTRDERLQHRVAVMRNGQQYIIELQDEALANALNSNFKEAQWLSNSFANVMRKGVRYMSAINTQYDPAFAIWNLARDLQIGVINNIAKESPAFNARFVKNIAAVQPVIMQYVWKDHMRGEESFGSNPELSRYLQEYFESGAQTGFSYMRDIQTLSEEFDKMLEGEGAAKRFAKGTAEFLSVATELSELTVRFAEFATARQMGFTTEEAAAKAKEVSVNFDRKGLWGGTFSSLYSFANATIQGSWNILRGLKSKRARRAYLITAAVYAALGVINTLLNPDDPDDDVFFSDYDRQTNFLIGKIKLPVTHFFRMFFAMGVNVTLWLQGKKTGTELIYDSATFVLDEVVPSSFAQLHNAWDYNPYTNEVEFTPEKYAQAAMPSVISPITDVALNRDFKGATIHREPFMLSDGKTYKRVAMEKRNTPEIYHDIAHGLHRLSGGNPDVKTQGGSTDGRIDINANDLQHIVEGYLGGSGSFTGDIISTAINAVQGELDPTTIPVVNRAFRPYQQERAYAQQYYLLKNRVEHYEKLLKDQAKNDREAYRDETRSELYRTYNQAQGYLNNLPEPTDNGKQYKEQVKELMKLNVQWNKAQ